VRACEVLSLLKHVIVILGTSLCFGLLVGIGLFFFGNDTPFAFHLLLSFVMFVIDACRSESVAVDATAPQQAPEQS